MRKCLTCTLRKHREKCLACEQSADAHHKIVLPEIIEPVKNIPLKNLGDREKAYLILNIVAGMTAHRISQLPKVGHKTVNSYLTKALHKIKFLKKPKNSQ